MNDQNFSHPHNNSFGQQYPDGGQGYGIPPQGGPGPHWNQQPPAPKKNWFLRHKILTAILALILLIAVGSAMGGGSKKSQPTPAASSSGAASPSDGSSASATAGSAQSPVASGKPVRDGKFEFTVTKVERNKKVVGPQYGESRAQGEFTLVYLTVKNIGTEQQSLSDSDQKALDVDGTQYSPDSGADIMIDNNNVLFTQINPGNQVKGVLVFDAPVGKKLTKIELHDSFLSGGAYSAL